LLSGRNIDIPRLLRDSNPHISYRSNPPTGVLRKPGVLTRQYLTFDLHPINMICPATAARRLTAPHPPLTLSADFVMTSGCTTATYHHTHHYNLIGTAVGESSQVLDLMGT